MPTPRHEARSQGLEGPLDGRVPTLECSGIIEKGRFASEGQLFSFFEVRFLIRSILLVVKGNKLCRSSSLFANQKKYSRAWPDGMFESSQLCCIPTNYGLTKREKCREK